MSRFLTRAAFGFLPRGHFSDLATWPTLQLLSPHAVPIVVRVSPAAYIARAFSLFHRCPSCGILNSLSSDSGEVRDEIRGYSVSSGLDGDAGSVVHDLGLRGNPFGDAGLPLPMMRAPAGSSIS